MLFAKLHYHKSFLTNKFLLALLCLSHYFVFKTAQWYKKSFSFAKNVLCQLLKDQLKIYFHLYNANKILCFRTFCTVNIIILVLFTFERMLRSSHQRCSLRKGVFKNFVKFTRKHLCQSLFFNKIAAIRPATLLKKRLWHRCFLWILRNL